MEFYNQTALECSKLITNRYSTSFSAGIKTLAPQLRLPVYAIYGFVRVADEIVDTFHNQNKAQLLSDFKVQTFVAIKDGFSINPVLHAFQMVVNEYNIEAELIESFLYSMEVDLHQTFHVADSYNQYIYGSAEVVGLMCLRVFCNQNEDQYQALKPAGKRLGAAFQKVNFLRDIKSDFDDRGRVYFPGVAFESFDQIAKSEIEADIQADFDVAFQGILQLPKSAKLGVYLAYIYYLTLFKKIKKLKPDTITQERVRVPDSTKFLLMLNCYFKKALNLI